MLLSADALQAIAVLPSNLPNPISSPVKVKINSLKEIRARGRVVIKHSDRMVTILAQRNSIRDVIAFPKNQRAQEMMTASPGTATDKQLKDLHIKASLPKNEAPSI